MALITPIQSTGGHNTSAASSLTKAFGSDVQAGSLIVVVAGVRWSGGLDEVCTDTQGNTYTQHTTSGSGNVLLKTWTAVAGSSGPLSVTVDTAIGTSFMAVGIAEIPAGTYNIVDVFFKSHSSASPTSDNFTVTEDGAALFGLLTAQVTDPAGITEPGTWTMVTENENASHQAYSFVFRNANIGTYQAVWSLGASTTCYMGGLVIEGVPSTAIEGSSVFGVDGDVQSTRTSLFNMDGTPRTINKSGGVTVGGYLDVTGDVTIGGTLTATVAMADDSVTNAKLANMAQATIKGRADGAGTGDPTDLDADDVSTILDGATDPFVRTSAVGSSADARLLVAIKSGDTARNSTTTPTDDPHLSVAVLANKTYVVDLSLLWTAANATMDAKFQWSVPSGASIFWGSGFAGGSVSSWQPNGTGGAPPVLNSSSFAAIGSATSNPFGLWLRAILIVGANAGNLVFQWSQNTSDGGNLTLKTGSSLVAITN